MEPIIKDVMTTRVVWVKKDASFRTMAAALREHRVSAFPVVDDDGKVIGVVSEARVWQVHGVVAVCDRLSYPPAEPSGGEFDVLASFQPTDASTV